MSSDMRNWQIELMKKRKLIVHDEVEVEAILARVNYYMLSGYALHLKDGNDDYLPGTSFKQIYNIYLFNKRLCSVLFDLIESLEVHARTEIANLHAHRHGPDGYLKVQNFEEAQKFTGFISEINRNINTAIKKKVKYVMHNLNSFGKLPIWVAVELVSMGTVSRMYGNLLDGDRKAIAMSQFGVKDEVLKSTLHCMTDLRNRCAHHEPLRISWPQNHASMQSSGSGSIRPGAPIAPGHNAAAQSLRSILLQLSGFHGQNHALMQSSGSGSARPEPLSVIYKQSRSNCGSVYTKYHSFQAFIFLYSSWLSDPLLFNCSRISLRAAIFCSFSSAQLSNTSAMPSLPSLLRAAAPDL
ncbi:Abortive infection system protein AbiD/AbiF-like protein [Aduncisulcus paluster]|uniref:Abortive infection system protein AbiD/AbiF-like protein n=1 Tax=Aduncisulcus paluster TaxID=2918883 RepID=A0ABQ5KAR0_9EUKA|nr:Abortive infection system protein AbiD/AbiF-like protein [Aduncisulcus paluster]